MTTNITNSQAASIADDKEFQKLLNAVITHQDNTNADLISGHIKHTNLMNYIDAKLAQARHEAWSEGVNIDVLREHNAELESRLAEIQRGVEGLLQYIMDHDWGGIPEPVPQIDALRVLLQPQGQADTSEQVHNAGTWQSSNFKVVDRKIQGRISVGDGGGKEMYYLDPLGTDADDDGPIIDTSGLPG